MKHMSLEAKVVLKVRTLAGLGQAAVREVAPSVESLLAGYVAGANNIQKTFDDVKFEVNTEKDVACHPATFTNSKFIRHALKTAAAFKAEGLDFNTDALTDASDSAQRYAASQQQLQAARGRSVSARRRH